MKVKGKLNEIIKLIESNGGNITRQDLLKKINLKEKQLYRQLIKLIQLNQLHILDEKIYLSRNILILDMPNTLNKTLIKEKAKLLKLKEERELDEKENKSLESINKKLIENN